MKKVTVPAHRIHNTSHQSTSVAACHMREKRWKEKGTSQRRDTQSLSGLALPSTKPSAGSAARANTYMLIMCSQPTVVHTNHRTRLHPTQPIDHSTSQHVIHTTRGSGGRVRGRGTLSCQHHAGQSNQVLAMLQLQVREVRSHSKQSRPLHQPNTCA